MEEANILELLSAAVSDTWGIWYLMGAILVFFMQGGFAMVETGFTRAKNAGNILMKNLMDFCIGTCTFILLGYGLMNSENYFFGLIGMPEYRMFTDFANFDWSNFFFQLVFCATAATIVSGSMAERTRFLAYCIYSAVISALIYPIEAGWAWNSQGWLAKLDYVDFAGSSVIHMVGGITACIGAILLGPRIGKYYTDKHGQKQSRAIPGHSLPLGALGCFILWFCWYGFNGAAATSTVQLAQILSNTTIAPAAATVTCMIFTWRKNGTPDVSMCLNASLAGLVAITAPCASVDAIGAFCIGIVAGILVDVVVEVLDLKLHIDDPVGAVAVHGANGIWGTLSVGLFDCGVYWEDGAARGLFYGGGFRQLGVQLLGVVCIGAFTVITMTIVFRVIRSCVGLRCTAEEEIAGLDISEHGLPSAYGDFTIHDSVPASEDGAVGDVPVDAAVPVERVVQTEAVTPVGGASYGAYTKVTIVCRQNRFEVLKEAMAQIGVSGMTVTQVMGCGAQKGRVAYYRGVPMTMSLHPKLKVEVVVSTVPVDQVVSAAKMALYTGNMGDGKIFIYNVENVVRIRTGEEGYAALTNDELTEPIR